ncbi:tyrosine-type recombinase/integrase [Peptostreptococcus faecalis]|uniref:tyrosine-type recombinase/integrase n=1 Tax=Peptostreptococcus faecalis TaxID=2045015 RepID=UPI000C7DDCB4|nr:hypothetical protein [Peptostreptococcus faecalis]
MYKYFSEAEKIIETAIESFGVKKVSSEFYRSRIRRFFEEYMSLEENESKPLNTLTYYDINMYLERLECSDSQKDNVYNALKRFFQYTYEKRITSEIISQVKKPKTIRKPKETLNDNDYLKLKKFIISKENDLKDRLLLGLFIFTGLSRKYISNLKNNNFKFDEGVYKLSIYKNKKMIDLPLKAELQLVISQYCSTLNNEDKYNDFLSMDENSISEYVSKKLLNIIGKKSTPTILSNTFISKVLSNGNHVYGISKLALESITTIENHVKKDDVDLENKQTAILNSF